MFENNFLTSSGEKGKFLTVGIFVLVPITPVPFQMGTYYLYVEWLIKPFLRDGDPETWSYL